MRREGPNGIMRAIALESRKYRKSRCLEKACRTMNLMLEAQPAQSRALQPPGRRCVGKFKVTCCNATYVSRFPVDAPSLALSRTVIDLTLLTS